MAEAIDDLDRLAMLFWKLTPRHQQLLLARACRVRWAELCRRQWRSRTTMALDYCLVLMALAMAERETDSCRHLAKNRIFPIIRCGSQLNATHFTNRPPMTAPPASQTLPELRRRAGRRPFLFRFV